MKPSRLVVRLATGVAVVLAAALVLTATGSFRGVNPVEHQRTLDHLSALENLNTELNEIVLRLRYGLLNNFDPLVNTLRKLESHQQALEGGEDSISGLSTDIDRQLTALSRALSDKKGLIERFTFHTAVLKNSVHYLPLSADRVTRDPQTPASMRRDLNTLLKDVLRFHVLSTDAGYERAATAVEELRQYQDTRSSPVRASLGNVIRHAENLLHYRREVDALTAQITIGENRLISNRLADTYNRWFGRQLRYANAYRFALLFAALILLAYGIWTYLRVRNTATMLDASESKYRSMVASLAEGVFIRDKEGGVIECNASAERILGVPFEQLQGTAGVVPGWASLREDGTPLPAEEWPSTVVLRTGQSLVDVVMGLRRQDGTLVWLSVNAQPASLGLDDAPDGAIVSFRDITTQKQAESSLAYRAHHDSLTGLPNRLLFIDRLQSAINRAWRHGTRVAVFFIDLDNFKVINDSLGHTAGDGVLQAVAPRLQSSLRQSDTVARLGGDEFVALAEELSEPADAATIASKLLKTLAQPLAVSGRETFVSASIGIAYYPADGEDAQTLLSKADAAMYGVKQRGRSTYGFFSPETSGTALEDLELSNALRGAVDREELRLHFQPILDVVSGAVSGVEALVRWQHPDRGLIPPDQFIALAEKSGVIVAIDEWVLKAACLQAREWHEAGLPLRVSVNLSAVQLRYDGLGQRVRNVLHETGLDPQWLELEITESMTMSDYRRSRQILAELHDIGVSIALDDFGTGYSSLSYLNEFSIDRIKIDRSFVGTIVDEVNDGTVARAIINIAKSLSLQVTAEGVETVTQWSFLEKEGCEEMQGYLFSRPLPARELDTILRQRFHRGQTVPQASP